MILVYSSAGPKEYMGMAMWNRDAGTGMQLDLVAGGGQVRYGTYSAHTYSPNGRYLIIFQKDVYVWDLQNLGSAPYVPMSHLAVRNRVRSEFRFHDNNTLDLVALYPTGHDYYIYHLYRWNLLTEDMIFKTEWGNMAVCDNPAFRADHRLPELIEWACSYYPS